MVENISSTLLYTETYTKKSSSVEATTSTLESSTSSVSDSVEITGETSLSVTYSNTLSSEEIEDSKYNMLRNLVASLMEQQGLDSKILLGDTEIDISGISSDEASELIAEDGYFGVEQTSERIFQFAVSLAGGDTSKLDEIVAGVEEGFQKAYDALGGWLPDICHDTYDAVMDKLNNWVAESESSASSEV